MTIVLHLFLLAFSIGIIWGFSGLLVTATDTVAKQYNRPGFAVAFFVLGILTSISEISVATNATIQGVPQLSAGNLIGGSLVIFLLIIPVLAILGGGVPMNNALTKWSLVSLLLLVGMPSLFILDGSLTRAEGLLMILAYVTLLYRVQKRKPTEEIAADAVQEVQEELLHTKKASYKDILKVILAGALIFVAGKLLIDESLYFSALLSIPSSLVGLILLSVGTNVPELVIAIRCVLGKHKDIAFGDYMGSAGANTLIMGIMVLANGTFAVERSEFVATFIVLTAGLILFFVFSRSKYDLSRKEGFLLLGLYMVFLLMQIGNVLRFSGD